MCLSNIAISQTNKNNIQKFESNLFTVLNNEVSFKNFDFECFTICVKIDKKGKIDTTIISLSAIPELRDRLNQVKSSFNYRYLKDEIKAKNWKNVNILIPILCLFESSSPHNTFKDLGQYADNRLKYFSELTPISPDDYLTNCIVLKAITLVKTQPIR